MAIKSVMTERGLHGGHENKTEGLFLFRLQARSNDFVLWLCLRVGLKPYAETQRFVPKFGEIHISVSFQYGNHPGFALAEAHTFVARVARPQVRWSHYCSRD